MGIANKDSFGSENSSGIPLEDAVRETWKVMDSEPAALRLMGGEDFEKLNLLYKDRVISTPLLPANPKLLIGFEVAQD